MGAKKLVKNQMESRFPLPYRKLGNTELYVSPICFGSMRLNPQDPGYKEALKKALDCGINFIDTSGSYGDGASELLIGELLREELYANQIRREDMVISTKVGQIQGHLVHEVKKRAQMGHPFNEIVQLTERLQYCLSPDFIENQISNSLKRLSLDYVDIITLQNPEILLQGLNYNHKSFENRIRRAFEHLEVEVVKGRIKYYGISSTAFLKKEIANDHLMLQQFVDIAKSITENHHFKVIQTPFNLFESSAILEKNQGGKSLTESIKDNDLSMITFRPLTSQHRDKVHYFITFPERDEVAVKGKMHRLLADVIDMEKQYKEAFPDCKEIKWGHVLRNNLSKLNDWWKWNLYLQRNIKPSLYNLLDGTPSDQKWNLWKITYSNTIHQLFDLVRSSLEVIGNLRTNQICHYLNESCPSLKDETKLSNKVTRLYLALEEVDSIVMGLGSPKYVEDLMQLQNIPDEETANKILKEIKLHF